MNKLIQIYILLSLTTLCFHKVVGQSFVNEITLVKNQPTDSLLFSYTSDSLKIVNPKIKINWNYKKKLRLITEQQADNNLFYLKKDTLKTIEETYSLSRYFYKKGKYNLAIKYGSIELSLLEKLNIQNKHYHNSLYLLGRYNLYNNDINNAIKYFKQATAINYYPKKVAQSLCQIAQCYSEKGDYYKSINYYKKGINLLKKQNLNLISAIHSINLASTCNELYTKEAIHIGVKHLHYADSILKTKRNSNTLPRQINVYIALATMYSTKFIYNFKRSKNYYLKAIKELQHKKNNHYLASAYLNLGELYLNKKNDSALSFLNKSLKYSIDKNDIITRKIISETYKNIANFYYNKKDLKKALNNIQKSVNSSFNIDSKKNISPSKIQYIKTTYKRNVVTILEAKINILLKLYKKSNDRKYLEKIINTTDINHNLIQLILEEATEQKTKFLWRENVSKIYFSGCYAAHLLNKPELTFDFLEKNKSFLLSQSVSKNDEKSNLPYHISNRDLYFRKKILNLENLEEKNTTQKKLKDSLFDLKFAYQNFNDSIQKTHPQYFKNKKIGQQISLKEVKKQLDNNTVILSYTINHIDYNNLNEEKKNKSIIGLLTTKNKSISFCIENAKKTIDYLNTYRNLISKPFSDKKDIKKFKKISFHLFDKLFPSDEIKKMITNKQLLIIPDNDLQNIPFESLNTSKDSLRYLIETNDISYAYSMSFLDINKTIKRTSKKEFIGFAPIHFNNKKLFTLEHSKKEIKSINSILNTNSFIDNFATKNEFLKSSIDAKIIHLATHVNISKAPVIHFNNDSLKLHELYTYKNNADLVVLSACETNLGEIKEGEGVLSLARGFFYSGSKSVVSSLWKVNDASTSNIMTDFYTNLKNRQTKVKALNNAKRKYLEEHSLSEKSPYYWASFILIGDTSQTFEYNFLNYFLVSFLILIISFLLFLKKR